MDLTCAENALVQSDGSRKIKIKFYNFDMISSVGYRVKSKRGITFRKWATSILKDYMIQGYAINQKRLEALKKTVEIQSLIIANALEIDEKDVYNVIEVPDYTDEEFSAKVENTTKEVEYMAEHGIISFDKNGYLTYVDVDKLEEIYGADVNTAELRELMAPRPMTRGHIENFTNCMVGKLAKSLGIDELRNLINSEIANYFSKGAYQ